MASVQTTLAHTLSLAAVEQGQLPAGFPAVLDSKLAWIGADFKNAESYTYQLTDANIAEIDDAVEHFKSLDLKGSQVTRDTFPLKALGAILDGVSAEIYEGKGFGLVRGLDTHKYSTEDLTLIYLGVQSYVADQRGRQDAKGNMLVHVIQNQTNKMAANHHRHSNKAITFHTDEDGDVIGWLTRGQAAEGGSSVIASAYAIYNLLASEHPELIDALASPFTFSIPKVERRPAIFYHEGRLIVNFGRTPLIGSEAHPRDHKLPLPTDEQLKALDLVEEIAHRVELRIKTQPGDIHFINNMAVLHRRDAFANDGTQAQFGRRHLVRVRCRDSRRGWAIPKDLEAAWDNAFSIDVRRGESWNLEPKSELYFPLRKNPN
ncbi:hypothetical protein PspLS_03782 [Pyricularia sp. CBS 133598]|nr:hypothetical protein PspLS_03782 [Pyricularia sp. CBS 133598]